MKARYIRVSSKTQRTDRQLTADNDEKLFTDVASGSVPFAQRKEGCRLLQAIEQGKITCVTVHSIDRLGRNLMDILTTLSFFDQHKVILKDNSLGLVNRIKGKSNPIFKLIIAVMGSIAEMERETLRERQREGIALAKARGAYRGRLLGTTCSPEKILKKYRKVIARLNAGCSIRDTAQLEGVSTGTVLKVKKLNHLYKQ